MVGETLMSWTPFTVWFFVFGVLGFISLLFLNWWAGLFCGVMVILGGIGYIVENDGF